MKRILLLMLSILFLFTSCKNISGDSEIVLPDIVFVAVFHYPEEIQYLSGTFIGTAGYYIDKNGEIKYFEFQDEENPIFDIEKDIEKGYTTMEEYIELRNLNEFHQKIREICIDTEFAPVTKSDLTESYNILLKINKKTKLGLEKDNLGTLWGTAYFYGVRINENNAEEYILIHEDGDYYYINDNRYAKKLTSRLYEKFSVTYAAAFKNKSNKLGIDEDENN